MFLPTFVNDHRTVGTWCTSQKARRLLQSRSCCHLGKSKEMMNKLSKSWTSVDCWFAAHLRMCFKLPGILRLSYRKEEDAPHHEKVVVGQTEFDVKTCNKFL